MICYINPDGSHVRGCDQHLGAHPAQWCESAYKQRIARMQELREELLRLQNIEIEYPVGQYDPH